MIRVLIIDDYQAVRSGIKELLRKAEDIEVAGEAGDYDSALEICLHASPDVVLVDISLPGGTNGITLAAQILSHCADAKILMLTGSKRPDHVDQSMRAGAKGYLTQASLTEERLAGAIRTVARGGMFIDDEVSGSLFGNGRHDCINQLTNREREILVLLGEGLANKAIAARLTIDAKTVRNHLNNVYGKLGISSRVQAAILAREELTAQ